MGLSRCAGDVQGGDSIRYPNGDLEPVVRVDRRRTFPDGRTLLWIYQSWGGGRQGRSIYWDNESLYRGGEIVPAGTPVDELPPVQQVERFEKWAH